MVLYEALLKDDKGNETITPNSCSVQCIGLLWFTEEEKVRYVMPTMCNCLSALLLPVQLL